LHFLDAAFTQVSSKEAGLGSIETLAQSIFPVIDANKEDEVMKMLEGNFDSKELKKILREDVSSQKKTVMIGSQLTSDFLKKIAEEKKAEQEAVEEYFKEQQKMVD